MHAENNNETLIYVTQEQNSSIRDVLNVLFRRKKMISLIFFGVLFAASVFTFISAKIYQSDAKLLIRVGRESLGLDPTVEGPTVNLSQSRENEVNSELAIIKSRVVAEKVVDKFTPQVFLASGKKESVDSNDGGAFGSFKKTLSGFMPTGSEDEVVSLREQAINKMVRNLDVDVESKSHVINLSFEAKNPEFGRDVLNSFLELYQEHHIQVHKTHASPKFFEDQAEKLLIELQIKEQQLEEFRTSHNIAASDIQKEELFTQISRMQNAISEANSQIAALKAQNSSLENALKGLSEKVEVSRVAGRRNNSSDIIKQRLFDFRVQESDLAAHYPDNHRQLVEVREQIQMAETALANEKQTDEVTTAIDPTYQAIQLELAKGRAQLQAYMASKEALVLDLEEPKAELSLLVKNEMLEKKLTRDVSLLEEEYVQYRQDMQRTTISRELDKGKVSNLSIIQPASMPHDPVKPRVALNMILGMFLGLFGGVSAAFFIEYFDDSIKDKEDVEKKLGLPVLASLPNEDSKLCT